MSNPLRPLTTRELIERAAQIYVRNFSLVVGISAFPYLCCLGVNLCFSASLGGVSNAIGDWAITMIHGLVWVHRRYPYIPIGALRVALQLAVLVVATLFGIIPLLLKFLSGAIVTAATSVGVSSIYSGHDPSVRKCYEALKGRFGKILYVFAVMLFRTLAGLVLLILPGVYWGARDSLAVSAVALEDIKGKQALARSAALTKGAIKRILIIYFVFAVLEYEFTKVLGIILYFIYPISHKIVSNNAAWIWTAFILILTTPYMALALALAYYDQRVRLEAFNVENMMNDAQQNSTIPNVLGVAP